MQQFDVVNAAIHQRHLVSLRINNLVTLLETIRKLESISDVQDMRFGNACQYGAPS